MQLFNRRKQSVEVVALPEPFPGLPQPPQDCDGLRSLAAHRDYVLSYIEPLLPFGMKLLDAVGLPLCEDLKADQDVPAVDVAHIDGYAVDAYDTQTATQTNPAVLACLAELHTGEQATEPLPPQSCAKVVAGVPLPDNANAVIPLATARQNENFEVFIQRSISLGANVRSRGYDISIGKTLLVEGDKLDPRLVGMLAGAGIDRVLARPRPRVVVIANGPELVEPGLRLKNVSDTYDANSFMVAAAARAEGATVFRVGLYSNDETRIKEQIGDQLIRADLVITTGGVSKDDYNKIATVVPYLGRTDFCDVAMEPGGRQGFGVIGVDEVPILMLPGNPLSAYVAFQAVARPVIRKMMGKEPLPPLDHAVATEVVRGELGKMTFIRAVVTSYGGRRAVRPLQDQDEHELGQLAEANALIVLGEDQQTITAGTSVHVLMLENMVRDEA